jgi:hypothetical protein
MDNFKTAEATLQDAALLASRVAGNVSSGDIRYAEYTYTATGTEAATGDTIQIGDVPVGCVVLPELCKVANDASMGGTDQVITKIGDASDDDRYTATSITVHATNAGITAVTPAIATGVMTRTKVVAATKTLVAGFTRTNAMTAGKKIKFIIAYRLN